VKIVKRTSCGEKPSEGACSEREHKQVGEKVEPQEVAVSKQRVGVDTMSETSHTGNEISRKVKSMFLKSFL